MKKNLAVVSYGGGVNSTALLVGLLEREEPPDLILFADTGGERDATYQQVTAFSLWLAARGFPTITRVAYDTGPNTSLYEECISNGTLPSIVFGNKGCSVKWKIQPQDRYLRGLPECQAAWDRGERVVKLIGIDAGEAHRAARVPHGDKRFVFRHPLIEWDWGREECIEAIRRVGAPLPGKSACWFCPSSKKREVLALAKDAPDLFDKAVAMERNAAEKLTVVRGLGRSWSWEALVAADRAQLKLFPESPDEACMCYDGEVDR